MSLPSRSSGMNSPFSTALAALSVALVLFPTAPVSADIQDPPLNDHGPSRKLARGIANIAFGVSEIPFEIILSNEADGNSTAFSYGAIRGVGRFLSRLGFGVYEVVTFPIPTHKGTYHPPFKSNIPWVNGGLEEFPPELGFETRYSYGRSYSIVP
jgi:putative exosortase-associated protein (TIGR04073 family)